ncbi:STAS/SEC14 domain-containing protein [Luteimonas lutimaris]|uniref:STAS/SEC14 domain-containing protein n=1 Tax=Luteimonas lutimaris TaxID=698645 RepID=A0ABP7MDQ0_9GAMM|nr:STAS/SEC14 domain-containing protein [Luteimonas sp.]
MLEFIESAADVVAVTVSEKITGADLAAVMDRLEQAMDRHEVVHVFAETRSIDGVEVSGLGSHTARAMPLFGKLKRFGRVAVVADQAWIRAGSRVESALLPFVGYRVFKPGQRAEALAWVSGNADPDA